jgi:carbamate kinase
VRVVVALGGNALLRRGRAAHGGEPARQRPRGVQGAAIRVSDRRLRHGVLVDRFGA